MNNYLFFCLIGVSGLLLEVEKYPPDAFTFFTYGTIILYLILGFLWKFFIYLDPDLFFLLFIDS